MKSKGPPKVQFCPKGHDTFVVGRNKSRVCKQCARDIAKKVRKELKEGSRVQARVKIFCINRHRISVCGRDNQGRCNSCMEIDSQAWYEEHKDEMKAKYEANKEQILEYYRKRYENNKEEIKKYIKEYVSLNRDKVNKSRRIQRAKRLLIDINFRLSCTLRARLRQAIKNNVKKGSAVRDLGCTISFFKTYIEDKFHSGMTWENWGEVWQLDHVEELSSFDLSDPIEFKQAVYYTNLQPLTIPEHRKKTAEYLKLFNSKEKEVADL